MNVKCDSKKELIPALKAILAVQKNEQRYLHDIHSLNTAILCHMVGCRMKWGADVIGGGGLWSGIFWPVARIGNQYITLSIDGDLTQFAIADIEEISVL